MGRTRTVLLGGSSGGSSAVTTFSASGGTIGAHAKFITAFQIGDSIISDDGTLATLLGNLAITNAALASTANAFKVTTTLASIAASQLAAVLNVTSAGSAAGLQNALDVNLLPGYTGSSATSGLSVNNTAVGTNVNTPTDNGVSGNVAIWGFSVGTTIGIRIGVRGSATGGVENRAGFFHSQTLKNGAANLGVVAHALNLGTTPTHCAGYFGLHPSGVSLTFPSAAIAGDNGATTDPMLVLRDNQVISTTFADGGLLSVYKSINTAGWGMSTVYAAGTIAATTNARSAAVATYTPAADGSFKVSGNVLVTTSSTHSFSLDVSYTDESNVARVLVLPVAQLAGSFITSGLITNVTGTGPYDSVVMQIRCKASTSITIRPSSGGTYTGVVYNCNAVIEQVQ